MSNSDWSRREFVRYSAVVGGGLLVSVQAGFLADAAQARGIRVESQGATKDGFIPNAFLRISPDNSVEFVLDRVEMGQGVLTSHAQMIAEELDYDPEKIIVRLSPADRAYSNQALGFQVTGGSTSVKASWQPLREAGAGARMMLVAAAAQKWGVTPAECAASLGEIVHLPSGRKVTYGEVASLAGEMKSPREIVLKDPKDFKFIGQSLRRLDGRAKANGTAQYGVDVQIPEMLIAVLIRSPETGGTLRSFDGAEALKSEGVLKVEKISNGVAVIARRYWQAKKAAALVKVEWASGALANLSTESLWKTYEALAEGDAKTAHTVGDYDQGMQSAVKTLSAKYYVPFMAHATMEPQNCTAVVTPELCEIWVPTQNPTIAQEIAAQVCGLRVSQVKVNQTFLGGGFGRRLTQDFVAEAVEIAMLVKQPVKLMWSREDDMQNDFYRPAAFHSLSGGVTKDGGVAGWKHRIVGQGLLSQVGKDFVVGMAPPWLPYGFRSFLGGTAQNLYKGILVDTLAVEGAADSDYEMNPMHVEYVRHEPGVPIGSWRSVGHSGNAFVVESFIDELAHAAGQDPLLFRRQLLRSAPRNLAVLELAAEKSGWGQPLPSGVFRGIAQHHSFNSYAAEVAEVSVEQGRIRVHRVVCAIDCGLIVNPDLVVAQIESSIVYGLSAALKGHITFDKGRVQQSNFHDFEVLRMNEMPKVEVHIVKSAHGPTGVGEPGLPPIAPAVANAVFAATGTRLRAMPLRLG